MHFSDDVNLARGWRSFEVASGVTALGWGISVFKPKNVVESPEGLPARLYQHVLGVQEGTLSLYFKVEPALEYNVKLHFVEPNADLADQRWFHVLIGRDAQSMDVNVASEVGQDTPLIKEYTITPESGSLGIMLIQASYATAPPLLAAVELTLVNHMLSVTIPTPAPAPAPVPAPEPVAPGLAPGPYPAPTPGPAPAPGPNSTMSEVEVVAMGPGDKFYEAESG